MKIIVPYLWYDKEAIEAAEFYVSVFSKYGDAKIIKKSRLENTPSGTVDTVTFELLGQEFNAMSAGPLFKFNESISFVINCKDQNEIDYYTDSLSAVPESEICGWVKDKYGLSWQIVPTRLNELLSSEDKEQVARVTASFLKMKRLNIEELEKAAKG